MQFLQYLKAAAMAAMAATASTAFAAEPSGYYNSCENKSGRDLLVALHNTVGSHTTVSYDGLYDLYKTSDVYPEDGKIWDMYSTKHWPTGSQRCGSYKNVGDCYNREHSFPKSWFNEGKPMYSDAFHLYPTDGKVNGQRSNYPFGECANGTNLGTHNGVTALGRCGTSTFSGYSGRVFEPDDEYKGDFARSYFYMAAAYNNKISSWSSDMLAKNNYPVFTSWAINLLLKWHRQDPVSKKELDRQEAVYSKQRNRNPFIDHPELAEHIWGTKTGEKWTLAGSAPEPELNQPVSGSAVSMGVTAPGIAVSRQIKVLTTNATANTNISVSGTGFSVSPATLSAAAANAGANVTVTFRPASTGDFSGILTVTNGTLRATVNLSGRATGGVPLNEPTNITPTSFTASWVYIGDADADGNYTLNVSDDDGNIEGYPRKVNASAGQYTVTDLTPSNEYRYSITSQSYTSVHMDVRTAAAVPSVDFLYDGDLIFATIPGEPSEVAELLISTEFIDAPFTVSVNSPFQISVDRTDWGTAITLDPDENRMYMRLNSATAGTFETFITATYGSYVFDDAFARGTASSQSEFFEDFEPPYTGSAISYNPKEYQGSACKWYLEDIYFGSDAAHGGKQALRLGRDGDGLVQMEEDRDRGIGTISFWSHVYGSDSDSKLAIEYSTDGGSTWMHAGEVTISGSSYREYTAHVGATGKSRVRLRQLSGKRWLLDDFSLTDNSTGVDDPTADRHQWDAYSHSGSLFVNIAEGAGTDIAIYCVDGTTLFAGHMTEGRHTFDSLRIGQVYIVVAGDFSRTVLIR